jgi:hypothetical protein
VVNAQSKLVALNRFHETGMYGFIENVLLLNSKSRAHTLSHETIVVKMLWHETEPSGSTHLQFRWVRCHRYPWRWTVCFSSKLWCLPTSLYGDRIQKNEIFILTSVITQNLCLSCVVISKKFVGCTCYLKPVLCRSLRLFDAYQWRSENACDLCFMLHLNR